MFPSDIIQVFKFCRQRNDSIESFHMKTKLISMLITYHITRDTTIIHQNTGTSLRSLNSSEILVSYPIEYSHILLQKL